MHRHPIFICFNFVEDERIDVQYGFCTGMDEAVPPDLSCLFFFFFFSFSKLVVAWALIK